MEPLKKLTFFLALAIVLAPFITYAHTADGEVVSKYETALKSSKEGVFSFMKKKSNDDYYKKLEKKRRLAKAHRKALLRKAKKSKRQ
ncbi:hypothetical protein [Pontibacter sp. H249]|uniref:hypothetical protein n=1 Tax=Pontibacter sp. H249 TaxID=3133420 RepID=UPI0030C2A247